MVVVNNVELDVKRNDLLDKIRRIVGRGFEFSDAYISQCKERPMLNDAMAYAKVTKKYVYIGCRCVFTNNEDNTEYGAKIMKYPLYKVPSNQLVKKIDLEDLFIKDLEKIYDDIKFAVWWETQRMVKIEKEKEECQKYVDIFNKFFKN